jgi:hypothetical protein
MPDRFLGAIHSQRPAVVPALASLTRLPDARPETDWLPSIDFSNVPDPMLGNGTAGNCVEVSAFQIMRVRAHHVWGPNSYLPTALDALSLYGLCTGYNPNDPTTDKGTDTNAFMARWVTKGIQMNNPAQTLDVVGWAHCSLQETPVAVDLAGPVRMTLALPVGLQSVSVSEWANVPGTGADWAPGSWGMHSVAVGGQRKGSLNIITWGETVWVPPEFLARYWVSTDVAVSRNWIAVSGLSPSSMDFVELEATAAALSV